MHRFLILLLLGLLKEATTHLLNSYEMAIAMGLDEGSPAFEYFMADEVHGQFLSNIKQIYLPRTLLEYFGLLFHVCIFYFYFYFYF